jgi:hypothetical protein
MKRPPEMWSIVRAISANRFALRYELQATSAPNSTRCVTSAIAASVVHASKCAPSGGPFSGKKWSQVKMQSAPNSSACTQAARIERQSPCCG